MSLKLPIPADTGRNATYMDIFKLVLCRERRAIKKRGAGGQHLAIYKAFLQLLQDRQGCALISGEKKWAQRPCD